MRYSFCFCPLDAKNIRLAAKYRQKCDEKTENVMKRQNMGRMAGQPRLLTLTMHTLTS